MKRENFSSTHRMGQNLHTSEKEMETNNIHLRKQWDIGLGGPKDDQSYHLNLI